MIWLRNQGGRYHAYHENKNTSLCGRTTASNAQSIGPGTNCTFCTTIIKQEQALEASS